jgi:hypothetical protein
VSKWAVRSTTSNGYRFYLGKTPNGIKAWLFKTEDHGFKGVTRFRSRAAAQARAVAEALFNIPPDEVVDVVEVTDGLVRGGGEGRKGRVRKKQAGTKGSRQAG